MRTSSPAPPSRSGGLPAASWAVGPSYLRTTRAIASRGNDDRTPASPGDNAPARWPGSVAGAAREEERASARVVRLAALDEARDAQVQARGHIACRAARLRGRLHRGWRRGRLARVGLARMPRR